MSESVAVPSGVPAALHRGESDLPFVTFEEGFELQLLQVDVEAGLWVIRTRFSPGITIQRHRHTGEVFAFTLSGAWKYLEYPEVNRAGSYLFEPAGSIHTLHVPESNTEVTDVWFAIRGANLNLDDQDQVETVIDAGGVLAGYLGLCESEGHGRPAVIGA
jgi:2,4'-dihydroxyacetophenone dioxygenase